MLSLSRSRRSSPRSSRLSRTPTNKLFRWLLLFVKSINVLFPYISCWFTIYIQNSLLALNRYSYDIFEILISGMWFFGTSLLRFRYEYTLTINNRLFLWEVSRRLVRIVRTDRGSQHCSVLLIRVANTTENIVTYSGGREIRYLIHVIYSELWADQANRR